MWEVPSQRRSPVPSFALYSEPVIGKDRSHEGPLPWGDQSVPKNFQITNFQQQKHIWYEFRCAKMDFYNIHTVHFSFKIKIIAEIQDTIGE